MVMPNRSMLVLIAPGSPFIVKKKNYTLNTEIMNLFVRLYNPFLTMTLKDLPAFHASFSQLLLFDLNFLRTFQ